MIARHWHWHWHDNYNINNIHIISIEKFLNFDAHCWLRSYGELPVVWAGLGGVLGEGEGGSLASCYAVEAASFRAEILKALQLVRPVDLSHYYEWGRLIYFHRKASRNPHGVGITQQVFLAGFAVSSLLNFARNTKNALGVLVWSMSKAVLSWCENHISPPHRQWYFPLADYTKIYYLRTLIGLTFALF
jgi:hypothetical protein